jgi:cation transport ATPase
LKGSAVLLVTHASHFISHRAVDNILLIVQGKNRFYGSWDDLSHFKSSDMITQRAVDHINSQVRENTEERDSEDSTEDEDHQADEETQTRSQHNSNGKKKNQIMQKETREHGQSSLKTWLLWFQRAGGWFFVTLMFVLLAIDRFAYVATEWFLAQWTEGAYDSVVIMGIEFPPQTDGLSAQVCV